MDPGHLYRSGDRQAPLGLFFLDEMKSLPGRFTSYKGESSVLHVGMQHEGNQILCWLETLCHCHDARVTLIFPSSSSTEEAGWALCLSRLLKSKDCNAPCCTSCSMDTLVHKYPWLQTKLFVSTTTWREDIGGWMMVI